MSQSNDDNRVELTELFNVTLSAINANGRALTAGTMAGTGTITNTDSATVSVDSVTVNEEDGTAQFTVTLSNPVDTAVSVNFATSDGTATVADSDYVAVSSVVNFAADDVSENVNVTITDDNKVELTESFNVTLTGLNPNGRDVSDGTMTGTGTITNTDSATMSIDEVRQDEGSGGGTTTFTFTVTITNPVDQDVTVNYQTYNSTASHTHDYSAVGGPVTIPAGSLTATFPVSVTADDMVERDEMFTVVLFIDLRFRKRCNRWRHERFSVKFTMTTSRH